MCLLKIINISKYIKSEIKPVRYLKLKGYHCIIVACLMVISDLVLLPMFFDIVVAVVVC